MNKGTWITKEITKKRPHYDFLVGDECLARINQDKEEIYTVRLLPDDANRSLKMGGYFMFLDGAQYNAEKALEMIYTKMGGQSGEDSE